MTLEEAQTIWKKALLDHLFVLCQTTMAVSITKRTLVGYTDSPVNAIYLSRLLDRMQDQQRLVRKLTNPETWGKEGERMKFDAIVGNPPYHAFASGGSLRDTAATLAPPTYHYFVEQAIDLEPHYVSMIIEARWYNGGIGLDTFRSSMLNDRRLAKLYDYSNSKDCFPTVDIAGGICYFLWDRNWNGDCEVFNVQQGEYTNQHRNLNQFGDFFVRSNSAISIIEKVLSHSSEFMMSEVSALDTFGIPSKEKGHPDQQVGDIKLLHSVGANSQGVDHISRDTVKKNAHLIDKYKVKISIMVPQNGEVGINPENGYRSISSPQVLGPGVVDSQSYLNIGFFDTAIEAENYRLFMQCKFTRFMMRVTYSSVHIKRDNFIFVPKMDFKVKWLDPDLYRYFELSEEEITLIEKTMRPIVDEGVTTIL